MDAIQERNHFNVLVLINRSNEESEMRLFIVGDVHGCLNTLKEILDQNWKADETLIFLGDLIDRGCYVPETVEYVRNLKIQHGDRVIVIMGNHEHEFITHFDHGPNDNWLWQCGSNTIMDYKEKGYDPLKDLAWFKTLPLYFENEHIFVSHAGIAEAAKDPYDLRGANSIIWNRSKKRNIGKMQIIGHTPNPVGPRYDEDSNTWNIDTAAVYGAKLTAIRIDNNGKIIEVVSINVHEDDLLC